jgi:hypothetical protein
VSWRLAPVLALLAACAGGGEPAPTLSELQGEVFTPSCTFSTCHASPGASGLVLEPGATWGALVEVESADAPGEVFVVPGDSEGSYLMAKLRGDAGIVGEAMPSGGGPLEAERADRVAAWIDAGALDD